MIVKSSSLEIERNKKNLSLDICSNYYDNQFKFNDMETASIGLDYEDRHYNLDDVENILWNALRALTDLNNIHLKKSLNYIENLLRNSTDALAVLDSNSCFILQNNAFIQTFSKIFACTAEQKTNFLLILANF